MVTIQRSLMVVIACMVSVQALSAQAITLNALTDFPVIDSGDIPFYHDTKRKALAINAANKAYRTGFAQAEGTFSGATGSYHITITTMTEEDGEGVYKLLVDGAEVATFTNPHVGPDSPKNLKPHEHTWENIALTQGSKIAIQANATTNGEIPEGDGTAWARGRWRGLQLVPATP